MYNQRGFIGLPVLIAILLGIVVLGGGAYFVVQQQTPTQTATENFDNVQTLPTTNNQAQTQTNTNTQTGASTQNPVAQDTVVKKPSATIDSLVLTSTNRTITGTASGVSSVNVGLYDHTTAKFNEWTMVSAANVAESIPVVNGRWSFTVSGSDYLVNGTTVRVTYDGPNPGTNDVVVLASGTLTVATSQGTQATNVLPTTIGRCVVTNVKTAQTYSSPQASGDMSWIEYTAIDSNGYSVHQSSGVAISGIGNSREGDKVQLCLKAFSKGCPATYDSGALLTATNLRTGETWEAPTISHFPQCSTGGF